MKLDRTAVTEFLRCFRTNACMKWRTRFTKERFVVLAEYFEQQTDCSRYKRQICQSRRSPSWRNQSLPFLSNKWKLCHSATDSWSRNLRTALEKYFQFQWNCKQTTGWSEEQHNKLWDLFSNFLWSYTYNFENIFTAWS